MTTAKRALPIVFVLGAAPGARRLQRRRDRLGIAAASAAP